MTQNPVDPADNEALVAARERMVTEQLAARGIDDPAVLAAMRTVPRHAFVDATLVDRAYDDGPLPIGHGQTISQPWIVAAMTQWLQLQSDSRVLDIGTGCGYQAAVLAQITPHVYTIEIVEPLWRTACERLPPFGVPASQIRLGDGRQGWPEQAPFDAIVAAAAADSVPETLITQLAPGGRLVMPVGPREQQELVMVHKDDGGQLHRDVGTAVRFVPLIHAEPAFGQHLSQVD